MDVRARTERLRSDGGFGLVEAVVALVIIFGLILVLMRTFDSSTRVLVESRRQSAANQFATELLERAQALEYRHIGLASSTNGTSCVTGQVGCATFLADFPALTADGAGWSFDGEPVVFANSDTFRPFLDFHERVGRGGTEFDRYIFVTSVDTDGTGSENHRRLTAVVRWTPPDGFRRSVAQSTVIAPFGRPSQPLIRTDVAHASGSVDIGAFGGDGAIAVGSDRAAAPITTRDQFVAGVTLPTMDVTVVSDFVSEARMRVRGASVPVLRWFGPDGVAGTADDVVENAFPAELAMDADDDPLSTPPLRIPTTLSTFPGVLFGQPFPFDLHARELALGEPVTGTTASTTSVSGRVAAQDDAGLADGIPYVEAAITGPAKTVVGFLEYQPTSAIAGHYAAAGVDLGVAGFEFVLYRSGTRGSATPLSASAVADRVDAVGGRTTVGGVRFASPPIELLRDDVAAAAFGPDTFFGWVVIEPPSVTVTGIVAGEAALAHPDPVDASTMRIRVWDPAAGAYVDTVVDYDAHGGTCASPPASISIVVGDPDPVIHAIDEPDLPRLSYAIQGTIVVNPWCLSTEVDPTQPTLVTRAGWETTGPIVVASLTYQVWDRGPSGLEAPSPVFDLTLDVAADTASIASIFARPGAT